MNIIDSNINNLFLLWKEASLVSGKYEVKDEVEYGFVNQSQWPNRIWSQMPYHESIKSKVEELLLNHEPQLSYSHFNLNDELPVFKSNKIQEKSKQYGMSLKLEEKLKSNSKLTLKKADTFQDIKQWCEYFETAFNYTIHPKSVELTQNKVEYFNICDEGSMAGTVILFLTGEVAGIHSLGITPSMRGKGYAKEAMHSILNKAIDKGAKTAVLQASEMAKNMYLSMGFKQDFEMYNFKSTV